MPLIGAPGTCAVYPLGTCSAQKQKPVKIPKNQKHMCPRTYAEKPVFFSKILKKPKIPVFRLFCAFSQENRMVFMRGTMCPVH